MSSSPDLPRYDVAVVGAGPAGSVAALVLARAGRRVVLLEKARLPRSKTCGGGLVRRALKILPDGVEPAVEHGCRALALGFEGTDGAPPDEFVVRRPEPIVLMTMRAELDRSLVRAAEAAGAELREGCEVRGLAQDAHGVRLETEGGTLDAGLVVGADGVLSTVAKLAGWTRAPDSIPALEAEVRVPEPMLRGFDVARFDFGAGPNGYGWVFPKASHLSTGVLTMRRGRSRLADDLERYLARVGVAGDGVERLSQRGYLIPVRPRPGGAARGRVLLAGDAAGLADPLTGEGISLAMWSGRLAAEAALEGPRDAARAYRASLAREILPELRASRLLARLVYFHPRLARAMFRRRGQDMCEAVTEVFCGERTLRSVAWSPLSWLKLMRATPRRAPRPVASGTRG